MMFMYKPLPLIENLILLLNFQNISHPFSEKFVFSLHNFCIMQ